MVGKSLSHYKILEELGRGGMGIVYKGEDTKLHRRVAIKVLPAAALSSEDDRARFYREARAAASLSHPNIATVYEIDEAVPEGSNTDDIRPFIAMEFIEGDTLEDRIKQGPLKLEEAVRIASEIASGLEAAHKKDIVHRDIKAANVMMDGDGRAKILDFGLAQTAQSTKLTRMGSTLGTVAYMSPEQARGEEVDARTDLWALGVTLYEMIAGRNPFGGDYEQAVVYSIMNEEPEPLTAVRTGVPMGIEWIVSKCLAKHADDRYQRATELLVDLRNVDFSSVRFSRISGASTQTSPVKNVGFASLEQKSTKPTSLAKRILKLGALLGFGLTVGVFIGYLIFQSEPESKRVIRTQLDLPNAASPLQAAITPDDRTLYYAAIDSNDGVRKLATYDFQTGDKRFIPGTDAADRPVISSDGRWVAFYHRETKQIWKMPTAGGEPTAIAGAIASGNSSIGSCTKNGELFFGTEAWKTIKRVETNGDLSTITRVDMSRMQQFILALAVAPVDNFITWSDFDGDGIPHTSWILRENETEADSLLDRAWIHTITSSGHALFTRGNTGDPLQTLVVPIDLESGTILGPEVPLGRRSFPATVSPSGVLVYEDLSSAVSFNRSADLYKVNASGEGEFVQKYPGVASSKFSVSEDGSMLAVHVRLADGSSELRLLNIELQTDNTVSRGDNHSSPVWGNADEYVYFGYLFPDRRWGTLRRKSDLSGANEPVFSTNMSVSSADVGRDDKFLVFKNEDDIWAHDMGSDSTFAIVQDETRQDSPKMSPDGRFIVYTHGASCGPIHVTSVEGQGEPIEIASFGCNTDWAPNGRHIYYQEGGDVFRVEVTTDPVFRALGPWQNVFPGPSHVSRHRMNFDVTHDGTLYVAYTPERPASSSGTIWIVHNWFEELNKIAPRS